MKTLRQYIKEADQKGVAIGHFNISNLEALHGIYAAAKELDLPVVVGLSEGEENFVGKEEAVALIQAIRQRDNYPIFLNADHHYTFESVKGCIDSGFDMVIIDNVKAELKDNEDLAKKVVNYARDVMKKEERDILVEAELGFIGKSSKILEEVPEGVSPETMTNPEDAKNFVKNTGIDLLAPSVGNLHGMVRGGNPEINPKRIKEIKESCGVSLVLHGGSGISDKGFTDAIKSGISMVHINTEIRVAYRDAIKKYLNENQGEVAPYRFLKPGVEAIKEVVKRRLKLFNHMDS